MYVHACIGWSDALSGCGNGGQIPARYVFDVFGNGNAESNELRFELGTSHTTTNRIHFSGQDAPSGAAVCLTPQDFAVRVLWSSSPLHPVCPSVWLGARSRQASLRALFMSLPVLLVSSSFCTPECQARRTVRELWSLQSLSSLLPAVFLSANRNPSETETKASPPKCVGEVCRVKLRKCLCGCRQLHSSTESVRPSGHRRWWMSRAGRRWTRAATRRASAATAPFGSTTPSSTPEGARHYHQTTLLTSHDHVRTPKNPY